MRPLLVSLLLMATALCACGGSSQGRRGEAKPQARQSERTAPSSTRPAKRQRPSPGHIALPRVEAFRGAMGARCRKVEPHIRAAAARHGVDVGLIAGVIRVESSFIPKARSHAGALGLMQVMPSTARALGCEDLLDPEPNIDCGTRVLKRFMKHYDNNLIYGLSGYNAGHRRPNEARRRSGLPSNFRYVEKVLRARASYLRHGCGA